MNSYLMNTKFFHGRVGDFFHFFFSHWFVRFKLQKKDILPFGVISNSPNKNNMTASFIPLDKLVTIIKRQFFFC